MRAVFKYFCILAFLQQPTLAQDIQELSKQYKSYFSNWEEFVRYINESVPEDLPLLAIIDSAFALHPLYKDEIKYIKLSVNEPLDKNHGTRIAGVVSIVTMGRAPLMLMGIGSQPNAWDLAISIKEAVDRGARVINCSWISPSSKLIEEAIEYARDKGVMMVFSAGNGHQSWGSYPAPLTERFENLIIVGSIGEDGFLSYFSNYGKWVDIYAPGENILSCVEGGYISSSGTSMSAPFISALLALMLGIDENLSIKELKGLLLKSTFPLNDIYRIYDGLIIGGRIDPYLCLLSTEFYSYLKASTLRGADLEDIFSSYMNSMGFVPPFVKIAIATAIENLSFQFSPSYIKEHEGFFSSLSPYLSIDYLVSLAQKLDSESIINLISPLSLTKLFEFISKYNFNSKSIENFHAPKKLMNLLKVGFFLKDGKWWESYKIMREMGIRERIMLLNVLAYQYSLDRHFWDWASQLLGDIDGTLLLRYGNWMVVNHLFNYDRDFIEALNGATHEERIMLFEKLIHTIPQQFLDFSLALNEGNLKVLCDGPSGEGREELGKLSFKMGMERMGVLKDMQMFTDLPEFPSAEVKVPQDHFGMLYY